LRRRKYWNIVSVWNLQIPTGTNFYFNLKMFGSFNDVFLKVSPYNFDLYKIAKLLVRFYDENNKIKFFD